MFLVVGLKMKVKLWDSQVALFLKVASKLQLGRYDPYHSSNYFGIPVVTTLGHLDLAFQATKGKSTLCSWLSNHTSQLQVLPGLGFKP